MPTGSQEQVGKEEIPNKEEIQKKTFRESKTLAKELSSKTISERISC